jgi:hypothetical protein
LIWSRSVASLYCFLLQIILAFSQLIII